MIALLRQLSWPELRHHPWRNAAERVLSLIVEQVRGHGAACLLATHSRAAAARADRSVTLTPTGIVA